MIIFLNFKRHFTIFSDLFSKMPKFAKLPINYFIYQSVEKNEYGDPTFLFHNIDHNTLKKQIKTCKNRFLWDN